MNDPVARTTAGAVRGRWRDHRGTRSAAFLGVPFAQAPVGDLRFAAPRRRTPWEGVRDAGSPGPTAQLRPLAEVTTIPEPSTPGDDVLNLTVVTPAPGDPSARLPVLVWIHGGGFMAGCQNSPWYDGATFAADGVVTVCLGYRLGAEAFLRLAGAPDNRAALDWVAGLTWVAENIAAFGGDPDRVTIAGQSAGGGAVLALLTSPAAAGLFARAMSVSGAMPLAPAAAADAAATRFTALTGLPATVDAVGRLSRAELDDVVVAMSTGSGGAPQIAFSPFVDGATFPSELPTALAAGAGGDVPLLLGATAHEFAMAGSSLPAGLPPEQLAAALVGAGLEPAEAARAVAAHAGPAGALLGQAVTDTTFRAPAVQVARARLDAPAPTWLYEFTWPSTAPATAGLAFHCLDLPFWWDRLDGERVLDATGPHPPQDLADAMHGAMAAFVTGREPGWPAYRADARHARRWGPGDGPAYASVLGLGRA